MGHRTTVTVPRLFAAADALLDAMASNEGRNAVIPMFVGVRPAEGTAGAFTQAELVEAMTMLVRMGFARREDTPAR